MTRFSCKPMRVILTSLLVLLILTLAIFGAQLFATNRASARAPDVISNQQWAAILGGVQPLLSSESATIYLPLIEK